MTPLLRDKILTAIANLQDTITLGDDGFHVDAIHALDAAIDSAESAKITAMSEWIRGGR